MENVQQELLAQNRRLLQNLNTQRHCKCEINQLIGEITGQKISSSTEINLPFYAEFGRNIKIGENVNIGPNVMFSDNAGIVIENNVEIGAGVYLLSDDPTMGSGKITVKKGAKIGARSIIYPGVKIGSGAIIKPASIIKKDIANNEVFEN